jgi:hypothetical protein
MGFCVADLLVCDETVAGKFKYFFNKKIIKYFPFEKNQQVLPF